MSQPDTSGDGTPTPTGLPSGKRTHYVESTVVEVHEPELYARDAVAEPIVGLDAIDDAQIAFYREHGYLAIEQVFTPAEVEAALQGMTDLIAERVDAKYLVHFEAAAADKRATLSEEERMDAVRKLADFVDAEPRLKALSHHARLLDAVRRLMSGREPTLFQDMGLVKPPHIGREKPWHQDCAYFKFAAGTPVVGVWIALDEATLTNGCMHLLDGAHRGGPVLHWKRRDWQICDTDVMDMHQKRYPVVAAPLKPGGVLLFDGLMPHGTPHNSSSQRRRAVQYHYCPVDAEWTDDAARLAVFGTEGKDVEC